MGFSRRVKFDDRRLAGPHAGPAFNSRCRTLADDVACCARNARDPTARGGQQNPLPGYHHNSPLTTHVLSKKQISIGSRHSEVELEARLVSSTAFEMESERHGMQGSGKNF